MGCVSSKHVKKEIKREILLDNGGDYVNHVVSLKSSTYGVLKLDNIELEQQQQQQQQQQQEVGVPAETKGVQRSSPPRQEPEVINAWELMEGLEEDNFIKRSPKSRVPAKGVIGEKLDVVRTPLKLLNQIGSPLKVNKFGGKENKFSPKSVPRLSNSMDNLGNKKAVLKLSYPVKSTRTQSELSPLFDPELVALYEKDLSEEDEQIKTIIISTQSKKPHDSNAVVVYTTTLRGIRKTFEECNRVRSIIESYHIQVLERDVSMDSGFKEELRKITGTKEVKVPLVLVRGKPIGGVEEIVKLEEEGKLEMLFDGIPSSRGIKGCQRCGGVRFVMCTQCNGSCKVFLDGDHQKKKKKMKMRCGECNENGLIQCPICC